MSVAREPPGNRAEETDLPGAERPLPGGEPVTGFFDWLEAVFFGGIELSALSSPTFAALIFLQELYPDAVSLAGLTAIGAGSVALAAFRSGAVDVGRWPRRSELTSLPLRVTHFSLLFLAATMGVAVVAVSAGSLWLTLLGGVVEAAGLATFPTLYGRVYGEPVVNPAERV